MPVATEIQRSSKDVLLGTEVLPQSFSGGWQGMFTEQHVQVGDKSKALSQLARRGKMPRGVDVQEIDTERVKRVSISFVPNALELSQAPNPLQMLFYDLGIDSQDEVSAELSLDVSKDVMGGRFLPTIRIEPKEVSQTKAGVVMYMDKDGLVGTDPISTVRTEYGTRISVLVGDRISTRYTVPSGKGEQIQNFYGSPRYGSSRPDIHAVKRIILESAVDWVAGLGKNKGAVKADYGWMELDAAMAKAAGKLEHSTRNLLLELAKREDFSQEGLECFKLRGEKDAFLRVPLDKETILQAPGSVRRVLVDLGIADAEKLFAEISSTWTNVVVGIRPEHAENEKYGIWFATDGNAKIDGPTSVFYYGIAENNRGFHTILRGKRHAGLENFYSGAMPRYLRNQVIADATSWVTEIAESKLSQ